MDDVMVLNMAVQKAERRALLKVVGLVISTAERTAAMRVERKHKSRAAEMETTKDYSGVSMAAWKV